MPIPATAPRYSPSAPRREQRSKGQRQADDQDCDERRECRSATGKAQHHVGSVAQHGDEMGRPDTEPGHDRRSHQPAVPVSWSGLSGPVHQSADQPSSNEADDDGRKDKPEGMVLGQLKGTVDHRQAMGSNLSMRHEGRR